MVSGRLNAILAGETYTTETLLMGLPAGGSLPDLQLVETGMQLLEADGWPRGWNDAVKSPVGDIAEKLVEWLKIEDPVNGRWDVPDHGQVRVWCDASSIAKSISVEIRGAVVADASWLR